MTTSERLASLKGQTIENVTAKLNVNGEAKSFILYLANGEEIEFNAGIQYHISDPDGKIEPEIYTS